MEQSFQSTITKQEMLRKSLNLMSIPELGEFKPKNTANPFSLEIIGYSKFNALVQKSAGQSVWKKFVYFQRCIRNFEGDLNHSKLMFDLEDWKGDSLKFRRQGQVGRTFEEFAHSNPSTNTAVGANFQAGGPQSLEQTSPTKIDKKKLEAEVKKKKLLF